VENTFMVKVWAYGISFVCRKNIKQVKAVSATCTKFWDEII
jgi:hypothetical protein